MVAAEAAQAGIEPETLAEEAAFSASANDAMPFYISNMPLEEKVKMGHNIQDSIPLCSFNGERCPLDGFGSFYDEALGNCFTFNPDARHSTGRPGAQAGLQMLLQSDQGEYLCTSQIGGFRVMIHNQTERPFADTEGFNIAPGKVTSVSLSQLELLKLPAPYGDCREGPSEGFLYNGTHTIEGCLRSCYQRELSRLCKCADPRYTVPANVSVCPVEKKHCLDYYGNCVKDSLVCDQCKSPCTSYQYILTTSTSDLRWSRLLEGVCGVGSQGCGQEKGSNSVDNFALLQVFYERMNVIRHTEVPGYELMQLTSDLAGVFGFCMGASVISMLEFIYALIDMAIHKASKYKTSFIK